MATPVTINAETGRVDDHQFEEKPVIPARYVNLFVAASVGFLLGYAYHWDQERRKSKRPD